MSEENRQQQSSAESTVAGAAKTGKAIASIAKGAATGGAHGAAVEAAKSSKKWIIPIVAVILLPVLIIAMLPSVIFGSLFGDGTDTPNGISDDTVLVQNLADINSGISMILSEGLNDVLARIDSDFAASGCDSKEVNNPFGSDVVFNANAIVSQYCAYKDTDATSISKDDMESLLAANKDKLYSFTYTDEVREVPSEPEAESTETVAPDTTTEEPPEPTYETIRVYTIDFIPAAVDIRNRAAVGSRKAAMLQRQKRYYATGRVKPGILMACRVLGVGNNTMTVEACGVDTEIYARNVSWEWFSDIADLHSTGDLVVARVMDVSYNEERDVYSVTLSIKEASENPDRAALEKITPNSNYFGVVTGVKDRVFFVRLQVGVNAKTKLYRSIDMPSRLDTVSFRVTGVDEENGIALGFITRIIKRHTRLR